MIYLYILVMAAVTYLIRAVPLTVFQKKIENRYIRSFLYYVPYTCLTAMTVPGIFYATRSPVSAAAGALAAAGMEFRGKGYARGGEGEGHAVILGGRKLETMSF